MKKSKITVIILAVLLAAVSFSFVVVKLDTDRKQRQIDELFATSYHNITLNMLNATIEDIGDDAIHMYNVENTKWSAILTNVYQYTSYYENRSSDLNYIIAVVAQSAGYNSVTRLDMDLELYYKLKEVPNGNFADEEILKSAKAALDTAVVE